MKSLSFELNPGLDFSVAVNNLGKVSNDGINRDQAIWGQHLELKGLDKDDEDLISAYINKFYATDTLEIVLKSFENTWRGIESEFLKKTLSIFDGHTYSLNNISCNISMFNRNIRLLDHQIFQVYFKETIPQLLISHELLHFIFYDYTSNILKKGFSDLNMNSGPWWDTAEVFNNVILSSSDFKSLLNIEGDRVYPVHKKHITKAVKLFEERRDLDDFIISLLNYFKKLY